jgi:hypothetical protein
MKQTRIRTINFIEAVGKSDHFCVKDDVHGDFAPRVAVCNGVFAET